MKKNFAFLFALFLMFAGTANVFADAYPFKITTDVENPELYAIKSGRGDAYWWTLDAADGTIVLTAYEYAPTQHWFFTEVTEGETTYLQLHPYAAEGKAMGYKDTAAGHTKVWAVTPGEDYDCRWIFDNNNGNAPYGLKPTSNNIYLSNYGGAQYKMGFWTTGPAGDGGTAMYYEPVSKNAASLYEAIQAGSIYNMQEKYGLVQETSKFYCNANQLNEGSLDNLLDNRYDTYFHSAWQAQYGANERHYLQAEVSRPVNEFSFYFKKRHNNNNNRPTDMTILGSADGVNYTEITNINSGFPTTEDKLDYMSANITAPAAYKYFRFVINATNNNALTSGYPFFTYSEFYIFPGGTTAYILDGFKAVQEAANNLLAAEEGTSAFNTALAAFNKAKAHFDELEAVLGSDDLLTPVMTESSLAAGKRYVVAAAETAVAMAAQHEGSTPYRLSANVAKLDEFIETACATVEGEELPYMFTLEAAEGGWLLKDEVYGKYLLWEEKRSLDLTNDKAKASVFEITINADGEAVIKLAGENRTIRYGAEDGRFACYTIGQEAVRLYEDAVANEFFVAYTQMGELFNTCASLWMIPAVSEKAMAVAEVVEAINAAGASSYPSAEVAAATTAILELLSYAWAMDAKYTEFKNALYACYDLQDNSTASVKVATAFAAVVDKYSAYQWSVPAVKAADFDAYIAELVEAGRNYALNATLADGFVSETLVNVESEWVGTTLDKSVTGYLYNPAAKAFLGTANSWGTQVSFLENGFKWTVSTEALCDFEWLFDGAEDVCAANVGGVSLVPHKWVGNKTAPVPFAEGEDNGIEQTAEGIFLPKTTSLFLALNEENNLENYTLVYDMKLADAVSFTSLYQTTLDNNDPDGEIFIAKNMIGISYKGVGYAGNVQADTWHKIVVVGNGGFVSVYVDGVRVAASTAADDRWIIKKDGVFFFLDNDGETTDVELAGIQLWKKSLSDIEVAQLSGLKSIEVKAEALPARTAKWTFDNADDLFASEVGNITLSPRKVGDNNTVPTEFAADEATGAEKTENGVALPKTTCLFMDLNEENDLASYTFVYDLKVADSNPYISMYQTDLNNNNDGDLFIAKGTFGINGGGLGYGGQVVSNQWHRLAFVVEAGVISTYIDGAHIGTSANANNNNWVINKEGVFLFLDESGEHTAVEVGGIQFWAEALTAAQIKAMGAAFDEDATTKVIEVPAAAERTYIVKGPLCHPNGPQYCHIGTNGYADQAAAPHVITPVGKNLYTIQQGGQYYSYKAGTTVLQKINQVDANSYWQFVTAEEFRSKYAEATAIAPVNATFEIPAQNFGYNNTEVKEWTGSPSFGGEWANFVAYKENTESCEMSTVLHNMPNGVYRLKVQGFYRQGTSATEADREAVAATRDNGTEIAPAQFFANDAAVTVKNILDDAGKNTTSTHGVIYGKYGKAPHSANDASVYFNLGLYEHEIVFEVKEGDANTIKMGLIKTAGVANDWIVMDNYRLEYLGAKTNGDFMGSGVVEAMTEGDKYIYYTDAEGKHHFLTAAGEHQWVVVDEPTAITFSVGKGTYAKSASHMTSNGFHMSNTQNGDGTGPIATSTNTREWESQVFYKNAAGKFAIRLTNVDATNWGAYKFVNIDPVTFAVSAGEPELADALYLWTISEEAPVIDTAIEEVEVSEVANRAYFTLGGVPVDAPVQGVNIVKTTYTNGKVDIQKIYVK